MYNREVRKYACYIHFSLTYEIRVLDMGPYTYPRKEKDKITI